MLVDVNPNGCEGDYYIGGILPGYDPSKPVIVLVQRLRGTALRWPGPTMYYGDNDMYAYAHNNGCRTAFVQFRDADDNAGSMWRNESVLRQQLDTNGAHGLPNGYPIRVAVLVGPSGQTSNLAGAPGLPADEFIAGAVTLGPTLESPAAGEWTLEFMTPSSDAYLALTRFVGGASANLTTAPRGAL